MVRLLFSCLLFSIFLVGCTEDIPIILPEQEEQLGAYVYINQTTDTASIIIERTLRFEETLNENNARLEGSASVSLFQDNEKVANFEQRSSSIFYDHPDPLGIQAGETYNIQIEHPDFEIMTASESAIKNPVSPIIVDKDSISPPMGSTDNFEIILKIEDQANISNYYQIGAAIETLNQGGEQEIEQIAIFGNYIITINSVVTDLQFITVGDDIFLSDETFDGKEVIIFFQAGSFSFDPDYIIFRNISESFYNFMRFLNNDLDIDYGAFLETIPVYSNFDMGFGVFAFFTEEKIIITE